MINYEKLIRLSRANPKTLISDYQKRISPMRNNGLHAESFVQSSTKKAGVIVLIYPKGKHFYTVLTQRQQYKGAHSGQISLPGGKIEPSDQTLMNCALRETFEEIGVAIHSQSIIRKMKSIYVPPSDIYVQPFLAIIDYTPQFILEPREVKELIEVNITALNEDNIKKSEIPSLEDVAIKTPSYILDNKIVWGATATILAELHALLDTEFS